MKHIHVKYDRSFDPRFDGVWSYSSCNGTGFLIDEGQVMERAVTEAKRIAREDGYCVLTKHGKDNKKQRTIFILGKSINEIINIAII